MIINMIATCGSCGEKTQIQANESDIVLWQRGELIQSALPYLSADKRELLISGMCGGCFDALFEE